MITFGFVYANVINIVHKYRNFGCHFKDNLDFAEVVLADAALGALGSVIDKTKCIKVLG